MTQKDLTQEQQLSLAKLKMMLDRSLASQGWPEKGRDYALEEVMQTAAAKSHVLYGASAPDADELVSAVFATTRGSQLKALIDEAVEHADAPKANSRQAMIDQITAIQNPVSRIEAARKAGLA